MVLPNQLTELSKLSTDEISDLKLDFSQLTLFTGGSVIKATITYEILAKTGTGAVIQGYGITEAGIVALDDASNFLPGSAGRIVPNTQLKVPNIINLNVRISK